MACHCLAKLIIGNIKYPCLLSQNPPRPPRLGVLDRDLTYHFSFEKNIMKIRFLNFIFILFYSLY